MKEPKPKQYDENSCVNCGHPIVKKDGAWLHIIHMDGWLGSGKECIDSDYKECHCTTPCNPPQTFSPEFRKGGLF